MCRRAGLTDRSRLTRIDREAVTMDVTGGHPSRVSPASRTSTTMIVVSLIVAVLLCLIPGGSIAGLILAGLATAVVLVRPDLRGQWRMRIICAVGLVVPILFLGAWIS